MNGNLVRIIISTGEPAGIGPDITIKIAQKDIHADITAIGDPDLLKERADSLGLPINLLEYNGDDNQRHQPGKLRIIPLKTSMPVTAGQLNRDNVDYVLTQLKTACTGCLNKEFDAMVTAPVQKSIINDAGHTFSGHTEFLAELCHQATPVMMLANKALKIALVTTHLPLVNVSTSITRGKLYKSLKIIHRDLQKRFLIDNPAILVCGLNPHAGEAGHLGGEEQNIITPVIAKLVKQGLNLTGPQAADTAFTPSMNNNFDVIVTMYHDQGLPVLKAMDFGNIVNITLGLPIIRTSVDHGTALELAASGNASSSSIMAAVKYAIKISTNSVARVAMPSVANSC